MKRLLFVLLFIVGCGQSSPPTAIEAPGLVPPEIELPADAEGVVDTHAVMTPEHRAAIRNSAAADYAASKQTELDADEAEMLVRLTESDLNSAEMKEIEQYSLQLVSLIDAGKIEPKVARKNLIDHIRDALAKRAKVAEAKKAAKRAARESSKPATRTDSISPAVPDIGI